MKSKTTLVALAIGVLVVSAAGCKKENKDPETNQLCDGSASTDLLPLTDQNHWEWKQDGTANVKHTWDISGTATYAGKTYAKVSAAYDNGSSTTQLYFRRDASGAVYQYSTYYDPQGQEFMYLPAGVTVGEQWTYPVVGSTQGQGFRKVTAGAETFSTLYCNNYSDMVKIEEYSATGNLYGTYWYKKGLGPVRWKVAVVNSDLMGVSLK